ncbi:hypothetical protein PS691_02677 [Pseudomonas fluorescens]|uniref:ABC-three component systems C-terminal domain-containing protein n=1 Tax=Pseudomonas fluorescens TaxID=294 RepID=A0A5E7CHA0_PSEFL|nr:hypothetical protein PS691_02677 [Pseudomonas fluorescens]
MQNHPVKSSAPGPYLGFSIQSTRMCLHLIQAPRGSVVALEVLDDVDVALPDGSAIVEQTKSGLVTNPIANWSKELWKTFSNWIDAIESGLIDLKKTRFRLYVVQKKTGAFAENLSFAHTETQVQKVVEEIRLAYAKEQPIGCKLYIEKFLNFAPAKLVDLVVSFELETGNSELVGRINDCLSISVSEMLLEDTCHAAIGWVKNTTDALIDARQYPAIPRSEFSDWLSTFINKFSFNHLLRYTLPAPSVDQIEEHRPTALTMMRQLELVEMGDENQTEAMSDFLQAKANKVRWAKKGLVCGNEFSEFQKKLIKKWQLLDMENRMQYPSALELDRGKLLYMKCMDASVKLNEVDSPEFFVRGTYQYYSNEKIVGWHPKYRDLLGD